jgi:hypothetical protein
MFVSETKDSESSSQKIKAMKKQIFILALSFISVSTLFHSCQKETIPPPQPIEEEQNAFAAPDSIQDLVGFFFATKEIFLIDPQYLESVLQFVGAFPTTDGRFRMHFVHEDGQALEYSFAVQLVPSPQLYYMMGELEDSEPQLEGQDEEGKWKLYKHATCPDKNNVAKETSSCETVANDADGAKSKKTANDAYKKCIYNSNENNLCREVMGKIGTTTYYEKLNCLGKKIRTEDFNALKCG